MTGDLTTTADLPSPFDERWAGATLALYDVDWYGKAERTALLKAPDARGAAALAAHFAGYAGGLDLANAGRDGGRAFSRFDGGGYVFIVRRIFPR